MNIIFGRNGQVARCLADLLTHKGDTQNWRFVGSDECNFENPENIRNFLELLQVIPMVIVNTSAYTGVDLAETEREKAMNINARSVKEIAQYCKKHNSTLLHYSTDYIFNGTGNVPFKTDSIPSPLNYYGLSKLEGERSVIHAGCKYYIVRTSWVYSQYGKNFVKTMLKLMQKRKELYIVADQIGSPTSAIDLARVTLEIIDKNFSYGVYHFSGLGYCSWYDFAMEIYRQAKNLSFNLMVQEIKPIETSHYHTPARRPLNSRLEMALLQNRATKWEDSLTEILKLLQGEE